MKLWLSCQKAQQMGRKRPPVLTGEIMFRTIRTMVAVAATLALATGIALAQECPRGDLDKAYCDRNGDLTADLPSDPKRIVNPSALIFAYTPTEDPAVYQK